MLRTSTGVDAMKVVSSNSRHILSVRSLSSAVQFIPPLENLFNPRRPDAPPESTSMLEESPKKSKYMSHEHAINLIERERNPERALEIFDKVLSQRDFNHNNSIYAIILNKLALCKKYQELDVVLRQMSYETCKFHKGIFLNLMKIFSKASMHERVLEMFSTIEPIVREKPSLKAISTCLNLLVDADQIDLARSFLLNVRTNFHLEPNTCIFNILVKHHCRKGDLECAFQVMKEMEKSEMFCPNLITYSTLIDGLCVSGQLKEAINLFEEMVSKHQIMPDALTYNALINGFCRGEKTDRAIKVIDFMKKNGCNPNKFNYSALLNGLCRYEKMEEPEKTLDDMKDTGLKPDTITYTTLINCLCRNGNTGEAIELLKEMKENECKADIITFNMILGGLCREGGFDKALNMLEQLPSDGVYLNKFSYGIVLNLLCKVGELEKAVQLLALMLHRSFVPHHNTSNELLVRLCEIGKAYDIAMLLFGLVEMGFKLELETWSTIIELIFGERKMLPAFELIDELLIIGL